MKETDSRRFTHFGKKIFKISESPTAIAPLYTDKDDFKSQLKKFQKTIDELQNKMYAHDRYGMLVIFQALDAAGKDSTMKAVFKNVNPLGTSFYSFKRPTIKELDHDFLWRCFRELPERGKIQVFNRSYYEEVLVVKIHPEIVGNSQKIPAELIDTPDFWTNRYQDIRNFENYLYHNGIKVVKFFLHISKKEQGKRLIERIQIPEKNWKFEEGDIHERNFWADYHQAYEDLINATSTSECPWYVIPADDKKTMQLAVAQIIKEQLSALPIDYPASTTERQAELKKYIKIIEDQDLQIP